MFLTNSAYFLTCESEKVSLKYLLAVLNSTVADFYFSQKTARIAGGGMRYTKQYVEQIPVPEISLVDQKTFISIVNHILAAKKADPAADTLQWEAEINTLVFQLYGLSEEEILQVLTSLPSVSEGERREIQAQWHIINIQSLRD